MTYYIGIDIAKYKHDCYITDDNGEVVKDSFSFDNTNEGFNVLLKLLHSLDKSKKIKIGFEATGHYASNLKYFLERNSFTYMELNPLLVKRYIATTTLRRTKTDKKDAVQIAHYLMSVIYKPYVMKSYHISGLKSLTRLRSNLVKERSKYIVRITNMLDLLFPEFKGVFSNGLNKSAFYILSKYKTVNKIKNMNTDSYKLLKTTMKNPISFQKFSYLRELAKITIGVSNTILEFELELLVDSHNKLNDSIEKIEDEIVQIMSNYTFKTPSISGIGIQSAASIIAEIGDFSNFNNAKQLLAFAGLEPSYNQSGTHDGGGKMVKHGSSYLRYVIMNCASTFYVHNPIISEYYWKKRNEGKPHRVALSHVSRKLINTIFFLETNNLEFNSEKLR